MNATDNTGRTPLHVAAGWGCSEACEVLLIAGAIVDARDYGGWTPLHWATGAVVSGEERSEAVQLLLDAGADMESRVNVDSYMYTYALVLISSLPRLEWCQWEVATNPLERHVRALESVQRPPAGRSIRQRPVVSIARNFNIFCIIAEILHNIGKIEGDFCLICPYKKKYFELVILEDL